MQVAPILLILEDEPESVEWVVKTAKDIGYEVKDATRVADALQICREDGDISVAIVDLRIGPDDEKWDEGWRFLEEAKFSASTQIVILTGHVEPGELARKPPRNIDIRYEFCRKGLYAEERVPKVLQDQYEKHQAARKGEVVIESAADQQLYADLEMIARSGLPVLITGPSGCGKENVAQEIARKALPENEHGRIETINCAALTENIAVSTLFGYVKGAFTSADAAGRKGILERIGGDPDSNDFNKRLPGILILDELAELPVFVQAQLLRMLQGQRVHKLGDTGTGYLPVIRVIACTNDEDKLADKNQFRQDLLARLDGWHITIGHPHERKATFMKAAKREATAFNMTLEFGKAPAKISSVAHDFLTAIEAKLIPASEGGLRFGFRELKAWVGRACALALYREGNDTQVTAAHLNEAWERRMMLAESEADMAPAPPGGVEPKVPVPGDKVQGVRTRFERVIRGAGITLDEHWDAADLRKAATALHQQNPDAFAQLAELKKQYSMSTDEDKRILYRAIKGTDGTTEQVRRFIDSMRQYLGQTVGRAASSKKR